MRVRWSEGAEVQREDALLSQPSAAKQRFLNRRMLPVGDYRMSYMLLEDEIIVISFVHGKSNVARDYSTLQTKRAGREATRLEVVVKIAGRILPAIPMAAARR